MLPDRVSNPGPLTYESGALPIALRGPAFCKKNNSLTLAPLPQLPPPTPPPPPQRKKNKILFKIWIHSKKNHLLQPPSTPPPPPPPHKNFFFIDFDSL